LLGWREYGGGRFEILGEREFPHHSKLAARGEECIDDSVAPRQERNGARLKWHEHSNISASRLSEPS